MFNFPNQSKEGKTLEKCSTFLTSQKKARQTTRCSTFPAPCVCVCAREDGFVCVCKRGWFWCVCVQERMVLCARVRVAARENAINKCCCLVFELCCALPPSLIYTHRKLVPLFERERVEGSGGGGGLGNVFPVFIIFILTLSRKMLKRRKPTRDGTSRRRPVFPCRGLRSAKGSFSLYTHTHTPLLPRLHTGS